MLSVCYRLEVEYRGYYAMRFIRYFQTAVLCQSLVSVVFWIMRPHTDTSSLIARLAVLSMCAGMLLMSFWPKYYTRICVKFPSIVVSSFPLFASKSILLSSLAKLL